MSGKMSGNGYKINMNDDKRRQIKMNKGKLNQELITGLYVRNSEGQNRSGAMLLSGHN